MTAGEDSYFSAMLRCGRSGEPFRVRFVLDPTHRRYRVQDVSPGTRVAMALGDPEADADATADGNDDRAASDPEVDWSGVFCPHCGHGRDQDFAYVWCPNCGSMNCGSAVRPRWFGRPRPTCAYCGRGARLLEHDPDS
jgi:hypothetical protein